MMMLRSLRISHVEFDFRLGEIGPEQECSDVTEFSGHSDFPEL